MRPICLQALSLADVSFVRVGLYKGPVLSNKRTQSDLSREGPQHGPFLLSLRQVSFMLDRLGCRLGHDVIPDTSPWLIVPTSGCLGLSSCASRDCWRFGFSRH